MQNIKLCFIGAAIGLLAACASTPSDIADATTNAQSDRFALKVALYPYIPQEKKFAEWIEAEFERQHPDIDLVVRPMDAGDLAYDHERAGAALKDESHPDHQHLLEIDTVILGELIEDKALVPFAVSGADFYPFAINAVTIDGAVYGVPHWTCGNFLMTPHKSVSVAKNASELLQYLEALGTDAHDLGGDLAGSYGSPVTYLDALIDGDKNADLQAALTAGTLETATAAALAKIGDACGDGTESYCGDDQYALLATGKLDAMVAYSERLNKMLGVENNQLKPNDLYVTPAPLGNGRNTFLFTDALVRSVTCQSDQCRNAAEAFANFYVSDALFVASVMSHDDPGASPRYLLPSTRSAMATSALKYDPIYSQIEPFMEDAIGFPNEGLPDAVDRKIIRSLVDPIVQSKEK